MIWAVLAYLLVGALAAGSWGALSPTLDGGTVVICWVAWPLLLVTLGARVVVATMLVRPRGEAR